MDRLSAMQVFAEIADRGSLSAAAESLAMSRAMVSRYLESLEHWLGVRLLHRTTRRVSLTDAGAEALQRCRQVLELTQDVRAGAGQRQLAPSGRLRITTSQSFAQAHLVGAVTDFLALHPQTEIELIVLERAVNLVEERIDLAVRITNQLEPNLVARRLSVCRSVVCAAPAYLAAAGTPRKPEDLRRHRCVVHAHIARPEVRLSRGGQTQRVPVSGSLSANETLVVLQGVLAGAGIGLLPTYLVGEHLRSGQLVRLLAAWQPETLGIHALYLSRSHQPRLLRAMLDFLAERFPPEPSWDRDAAVVRPPTRAAAAARAPRRAAR